MNLGIFGTLVCWMFALLWVWIFSQQMLNFVCLWVLLGFRFRFLLLMLGVYWLLFCACRLLCCVKLVYFVGTLGLSFWGCIGCDLGLF